MTEAGEWRTNNQCCQYQWNKNGHFFTATVLPLCQELWLTCGIFANRRILYVVPSTFFIIYFRTFFIRLKATTDIESKPNLYIFPAHIYFSGLYLILWKNCSCLCEITSNNKNKSIKILSFFKQYELVSKILEHKTFDLTK